MSASYSNSGTETMKGHLCAGGLTREIICPSEGYSKTPEGLIRTIMFFRNDKGMLPNLTTVGAKIVEIEPQSLNSSNDKQRTQRFIITSPAPGQGQSASS
jgi:L,D-peptidoglycan transpeptidase YkuD (ErfK/YbiS/YcfS/YnhG family)